MSSLNNHSNIIVIIFISNNNSSKTTKVTISNVSYSGNNKYPQTYNHDDNYVQHKLVSGCHHLATYLPCKDVVRPQAATTIVNVHV